MIVVRSSDLGGLTPEALLQVMGLPAEELVVVIQTLDDDGPRIPPLEPEDPLAGLVHLEETPGLPQRPRQEHVYPVDVDAPVEGEAAFSSPGIQSRSTDFKSVARVNAAQSPKAPPETPHDVSTLPAGSACLVKEQGGAGGPDQDRAGHVDAAGRHPADPLLPMDTKPHRLERGASWGEIQATAKAMRITASLGAGSGVTLTDAFGATVYPDMPAARDALNARWAHFNAIGTTHRP